MKLETHEQRRGRTRVPLGAVIVAACLVLGACGEDGEASGQDERSTTTESTEESTSTTEPPGSDPEAVQPIIEALVVHVGEVHDEMGQTPSVVTDPDSEVVQRLRSLHTPTSEDVERILAAYETQAATGGRYEPVTPGEPTYRSEVLGEVREVDDDTVEFYTCTTYHYRFVGAPEQGGELLDGIAHPGLGTAERVDGVWLIDHLTVDDSQACPAEEGA